MTAGIPGTDFAPIVRSIQAANPDILYLACYPLDSVGMVSAISEAGLRVKVFGGGLIGLQYAAVKHQLGPLLNGAPSFGTYVREPTMQFPGIKDFFGRYQKRVIAEGADELGFYTPPLPTRGWRSWRRPLGRRRASMKSGWQIIFTRQLSRPSLEQ